MKNLTSLRQPSIRDVSFDLHQGEILGIAGLVGAKRTDIVETLFGIRERWRAPSSCTARRLTTTAPTKPSTTVLRW